MHLFIAITGVYTGVNKERAYSVQVSCGVILTCPTNILFPLYYFCVKIILHVHVCVCVFMHMHACEQ